MRRNTGPLVVVPLFLVLLLGCSEPTPTRFNEANRESKGKTAVAIDALEGSNFNKFFPKVESPYDMVYKQEKKGTSIASLKKDGREIATLTIFDTISNPEAKDEYKATEHALAGYPLVAKGNRGTAVLVAQRFQVQVRASDETLDEEGRKEWLKKFDLDGLSKLN